MTFIQSNDNNKKQFVTFSSRSSVWEPHWERSHSQKIYSYKTEPTIKLNVFIKSLSAAPLCRPPLLPRMPCFPLALSLAECTHPLAFGSPCLRPADGGAGQPRFAVTAPQLPPQLGGPPQQTGLPLPRDPLTPFSGQIADTAQTGRTVTGAHTARHLRSCKRHTVYHTSL